MKIIIIVIQPANNNNNNNNSLGNCGGDHCPAIQVAPDGPSIILYPRSHWNMICRPFCIFLNKIYYH